VTWWAWLLFGYAVMGITLAWAWRNLGTYKMGGRLILGLLWPVYLVAAAIARELEK